MKVLMLGWELPPFNSGGLGVACYQLCKYLARDTSTDIEFVVPYQVAIRPSFMRVHGALPLPPRELMQHTNAYGSPFFRDTGTLHQDTIPRDIFGVQTHYTRYVETLVRQKAFDAIHAHDWLTFQAGVRAKELTRIPLIAHVHATEFDRAGMRRGNELVHHIERNALIMADRVIAVSDLTKRHIVREYAIPADKIDVIHNAIDPDDYGELSAANAHRYLEEMKNLGYKVVVSIGRLSLQKGIPHLLAAARRVIEKDSKILFMIVGDGELRDELIHMAADYGVSQHVIFTGFLRGKQWRDSYDIADIFVMPSISEPFGLSALEAASYHTAVLLSRQCGAGEVLRAAMQFDVWDTDKLANEILTIARHSVLQTALADSARRETAYLTWDKAVQKLHRLYTRHIQPAAKVVA